MKESYAFLTDSEAQIFHHMYDSVQAEHAGANIMENLITRAVSILQARVSETYPTSHVPSSYRERIKDVVVTRIRRKDFFDEYLIDEVLWKLYCEIMDIIMGPIGEPDVARLQ